MFEYLIAFGAGLISFLSPCVLPLIPGYISYISGQSLQEILNQKNHLKLIKNLVNLMFKLKKSIKKLYLMIWTTPQLEKN